jgi:hypothetical protein
MRPQDIDLTVARDVITHPEFHVDDAVAVAMVLSALPNTRPLFLNDAQVARRKGDPTALCIGTGKGPLDDHGNDEEGRKEGVFAALLVAEMLDLVGNPVFAVLLEEIGRSDLTGRQNYMEWGELLKTLHAHGQDLTDMQKFRLIDAIVKAHIAFRSGYDRTYSETSDDLAVPVNVTVTALTEELQKTATHLIMPAFAPAGVLCQAWLLCRHIERKYRKVLPIIFVGDEAELELYSSGAKIFLGIKGGHITPEMDLQMAAEAMGITKQTFRGAWNDAREFHREFTREDQRPFDFVNVMGLLASHGEFDRKQYYAVAETVFNAYSARAYEMNVLCPREFREHGRYIEERGFRLAFVESDLCEMHSYLSRRVNADVIVIRKAEGGVSIFTSQQARDLSPYLAQSIIRAELELLDWSLISIGQYVNAESRIDVKRQNREFAAPLSHWYYQVRAGRLMNGSNTHKVMATRLSNEALLDAVTISIRIWESEQDSEQRIAV